VAGIICQALHTGGERLPGVSANVQLEFAMPGEKKKKATKASREGRARRILLAA
jgi:hypothetical protein